MNKRSIKLPVNLFKNDNDTRVKNKHYFISIFGSTSLTNSMLTTFGTVMGKKVKDKTTHHTAA